MHLLQALEGDWPGVLRSKGFVWIATRHDLMALWSQAGLTMALEPIAPWLAALEPDEWELDGAERAAVEAEWDATYGDRRQEVAFIGVDQDEAEIRRALDRALPDDEEMAGGPARWATLTDPLPAWDLDEVDLHRA